MFKAEYSTLYELYQTIRGCSIVPDDIVSNDERIEITYIARNLKLVGTYTKYKNSNQEFIAISDIYGNYIADAEKGQMI